MNNIVLLTLLKVKFMKRSILLAAAAIAALAGCSKVEVKSVDEAPARISWNAVVSKASTRAYDGAIQNTTYPKDETFGSFAYIHDGDFSVTGTNKLYINNAEIKYVTSENLWHADIRYYWPKNSDGTNYKLTFYSYSPYDELNTAAAVSCTADKGVKIDNWDVFAKSTVDVMTTERLANQTYNTSNSSSLADKGVPTAFKHKLTQIKDFIVKTKAEYPGLTFTVKSIKILSVNHKGTLAENVWTPTTDLENYTWYNDLTGVTVDQNETKITPNSLPASLNNYDVANPKKYFLLVLPQVFAAGRQKLQIVYNINNGTYNYDVTNSIDLKTIHDSGTGDKNPDWVMNKKITYTITLGMNEIYWDPTVVEWKDESEGYSID